MNDTIPDDDKYHNKGSDSSPSLEVLGLSSHVTKLEHAYEIGMVAE
jgi:hypothetical protein